MATAGPSRLNNIAVLSDHLSDSEDSEWNVLGTDTDMNDIADSPVCSSNGHGSFHDSPEHHHRPSRPTIAPIFTNQPALNYADRGRGAPRRKESTFGKVLRKFGSRIPMGFYYDGPRRQRRGKPANFWTEGVMVRNNHTRKEHWMCLHCYDHTKNHPEDSIAVYLATGTAHIREHLLRKHYIMKDGSKQHPEIIRQIENAQKRKNLMLRPIGEDEFKALLIDFKVSANLTGGQATDLKFLELLKVRCPRVRLYYKLGFNC